MKTIWTFSMPINVLYYLLILTESRTLADPVKTTFKTTGKNGNTIFENRTRYNPSLTLTRRGDSVLTQPSKNTFLVTINGLRRVQRSEATQNDDEPPSFAVYAVINTTAILPCRLDKRTTEKENWVEQPKGKLLWKRTGTDEYLIHDNKRLHADPRYSVAMSSFNQTIMDLHIDRVQIADEDTYLCLYSTGHAVLRQKVKLDVLIPPAILENGSSPPKVVVREGENAVLYCKASGIPRPQLTWYLIPPDGPERPIVAAAPSTQRYSVHADQLIVSNVSHRMIGLFKCVGHNGLKRTASHIIELDIHFPPTIQMASTQIGQQIHRNTILQAAIRGNPMTEIHWEFNRRPIQGATGNCLLAVPGEKYCTLIDRINSILKEVWTTLFITNLTIKDYGYYSCVVESPFGIFRNSTEVFRTYPSSSITPWTKIRYPYTTGLRHKPIIGRLSPRVVTSCHSSTCRQETNSFVWIPVFSHSVWLICSFFHMLQTQMTNV